MSAYGDCAVDVETTDPNSYLNFYKKNLELRKKFSDFKTEASLTYIDAPNGVLAFKRGQSILVATNTSSSLQAFAIDREYVIIQDSAGESKIEGNSLVIAAESTVWLHAK
jgi:alpha-glucosidase